MTQSGSTYEQSMQGGFTREQELITDELFAIGTKLANSKSHVNFLRFCEMKDINSLIIERKKHEEEARILSAKVKN